jgi:type IV secretory pathway VirB4 component
MLNKRKKINRDLGGFGDIQEVESVKQSNKNDKSKQSSKKSNKKGKKGKNVISIPKTVQDTIPYLAIYKNGIIELEPGVFSKSYKLEDVNFKVATDEEQREIFDRYVDFLNTFDSDIRMELTIFNRNIDEEHIRKKILIPFKRDNLNEYREEYNTMLREKMKEGRNNIVKEKYITLTMNALDSEDAFTKFSKIDGEVKSSIKRINGMETDPMTAVERLEVLADIYGDDSNGNEFYRKMQVADKTVESFDFSWMLKQGLTTKDLIGPSSFSFERDFCMIGDKYAKTLFIDSLPTWINSNILTEITELNSNMLMSIVYKKLRSDNASNLLRNQLVNINSNVVDAQKRAAKSGYSPDLISPELLRAQREAQELMDDITSNNQSLILATFVITIMADSKDEINKNLDQLKTIMGKYMCQIKCLNFQQEKGLSTALPLGRCDIFTDRLLTTESAAIFIPFSTQELAQKNGMYYGLNAVSKNLLLFNRKNSKNANGVILGTPGSGKSFSAKREMVNVILNTDDDIYIIDPEREYLPLAELLGGSVIRIAAGGKTYLNPMDMDMNYGKDDEKTATDPIAMKCDFIAGLCETMSGDKRTLTANQKSIVDRCVRILYQPYLKHMSEIQRQNTKITCDTTASPTLKDFYEMLLGQPEYEAQSLALALERFCVGSLDTFAHKTNVQRNNRFVVYDIKDIGEGMKELGLQVCLNAVWNQIIENFKIKRYTWFYLDEFYLLTQTESSAAFLQQVYKRARKWLGIPTGITQNVGDLLASPQAVAILNNCDFIMMLNQSPMDKMQLAQLLNISPTQLSYITNSDPGQGLIYTGKSIVPFIDQFPTNNRLYKVMTTKPDDLREQYQAQ